MSGVSALATTFNTPNYVGPLFQVTPDDTPFSSMIGALTGGGEVTEAQDFQWQSFDLRSNGPRQAAEGADAPTAESRVRTNIYNTVQAIHETVGVTYRRRAARGQYSGQNISGTNPVGDELAFQTMARMKEIKLDMEWSFLRSTFFKATTTSEISRTRGFLPAIQVNRDVTAAVNFTNGGAFTVTEADPGVFTTTGGAHGLSVGDQIQFTAGSGVLPTIVHTDGLEYVIEEARTYFIAVVGAATTFQITDTIGSTTGLEVTDDGTADATRLARECSNPTTDLIDSLMQQVYENGGIQEMDTALLMCNPYLKRWLSFLYINDRGYQELSRTIGGVRVTTIETDFGTLNVKVNRHMPAGSLAVVSLAELKPRWLLIPDRGFLFTEKLGVRGSLEEYQIYGEYGLEYGNERAHGLITHLTATGTIS